MAVITPFFDVVAGVAILAGRSSLLDTGIFKTANTNFTIRHLLALGFIGYGGWNLWKIERAQDKLKKSLGAESFEAEDDEDYGPKNPQYTCAMCGHEWSDDDGMPCRCDEDEDEEYLMDNFGDMEYIILRLLTDAQLEDEYGDYMRELGIGRKDLPQQLEDDYRTDDEAEYLREKYLDEEYNAESMLVKSDDLMVALMGFDGSFRTDGEVKVGYTTAAELGYEPKQLKPVMWVWDDIEGYGAFMATEDIRFV
ncbi:MAG: hypothetical protein CML44_04065 [Rhodobacteraceae bacterium]|nr:hypothetical protein [Paracoccaceae bacterium]